MVRDVVKALVKLPWTVHSKYSKGWKRIEYLRAKVLSLCHEFSGFSFFTDMYNLIPKTGKRPVKLSNRELPYTLSLIDFSKNQLPETDPVLSSGIFNLYSDVPFSTILD